MFVYFQMARRSSKKRSRGSHDDWKGKQFSIEIFLRVWNHLQSMCQEKEYFALHWIMQSEVRLKLFLSCIIGLEVPRMSKGLLVNGFHNCKASPIDADSLSSDMWSKAEALFHNPFSFSSLP